jgi:hypothetical protein
MGLFPSSVDRWETPIADHSLRLALSKGSNRVAVPFRSCETRAKPQFPKHCGFYLFIILEVAVVQESNNSENVSFLQVTYD